VVEEEEIEEGNKQEDGRAVLFGTSGDDARRKEGEYGTRETRVGELRWILLVLNVRFKVRRVFCGSFACSREFYYEGHQAHKSQHSLRQPLARAQSSFLLVLPSARSSTGVRCMAGMDR